MDQNFDNDRIIKINIEEEMKSSYIDYSMSVIVARALPDVRDGFKPVHRRILYGMMNINNVSTQPYKKCARTVFKVRPNTRPATITKVIVIRFAPCAVRLLRLNRLRSKLLWRICI